jgi:ABC-type phosphate/phosphonate transport system substrate-binding protein
VLSTAPDLPIFQQRTLAGEYDLVITGPPLAWAAHKAGAMQPIAIATRPLRIFVVVARHSPIQSVAELRGKAVGVLPPPSFAPAILADILRSHGLAAGTDVDIRHDRNPYNSVKAVTMGELAAAAYPSVSLPSLPAELLEQVRTIDTSADFPAVIFCARSAPDLPSPESIQAVLFNFVRDTPAGKLFLEEFGHDGLAPPDLKALRILDRFLPH